MVRSVESLGLEEHHSNFTKDEVALAQEGDVVPFWFVKREYVLNANGKPSKRQLMQILGLLSSKRRATMGFLLRREQKIK